MKRQVVSFALMIVIAGCGGSAGSSLGGQSTNASAPTTNAVALPLGHADPPQRQNLIVMTENDHHDTGITAACGATVTLYSLGAQRGDKIRWNIQNDLFNECADLDENKVELRFGNKAALASDKTLSSQLLTDVKAKKRKIEGFVHVDIGKVPDGTYKYTVYYDGKPASPDPQLDINGDSLQPPPR